MKITFEEIFRNPTKHIVKQADGTKKMMVENGQLPLITITATTVGENKSGLIIKYNVLAAGYFDIKTRLGKELIEGIREVFNRAFPNEKTKS